MKDAIDLRPEESLVREIIENRVRKWLKLASPLFIGMLALALVLHMKASLLEGQNEALAAEVASLEAHTQFLTPLASDLREVSAGLGALNALLHEPDWTALLSDVAAAAAGHIRLREVSVARGENDDITERAITLGGYARANSMVVQFLDRLATSPHLAQLELEVSRAARRSEVVGEVEFQIRGLALVAEETGDV